MPKSRFFVQTLLVALIAGLVTQPAPASDDGPEALLAALAAEGDETVRLDIISELGTYEADEVRLALEALAGDDDSPPAVRMEATCALASSATEESVPMLMAITEKDLEERHGYWACSIPLLGQLQDRRALPLLVSIGNLDGDDLIGMDHMAISAVAQMAGPGEVPYLISKVAIWPVRHDVIAALARIATPETAETLVLALQDGEEPETIAAAEQGLLTIGKPALPALEAALQGIEGTEYSARIRDLIAVLH